MSTPWKRCFANPAFAPRRRAVSFANSAGDSTTATACPCENRDGAARRFLPKFADIVPRFCGIDRYHEEPPALMIPPCTNVPLVGNVASAVWLAFPPQVQYNGENCQARPNTE